MEDQEQETISLARILQENLQQPAFFEVANEGKLPRLATPESACLDCFANVDRQIRAFETVKIPLGFSVKLPKGYFLELRGRSGLALKGLQLHVGTIDADYHPNEVCAIVTYIPQPTLEALDEGVIQQTFRIHRGDRVAQVRLVKVEGMELVKPESILEPMKAERVGGFGSTGQ